MARPNKPQISFVFGSSTPRELSHHVDDIGKKGLKARLGEGGKEKRDLLYYMRQAKSTEAREPKGTARGYAFGSSTPRSLSHMGKVPRDQRVYDAKLVKEKSMEGVRTSTTNPQLAGTRLRREMGRSVSTESRNDADEAASEPDIVQDRMVDFSRNSIRASAKVAGVATKKDSTAIEKDRGRTKAKRSTGSSTPVRKKTSTMQQENEVRRDHEGKEDRTWETVDEPSAQHDSLTLNQEKGNAEFEMEENKIMEE
uniref:Uncharacterized protein n=1 Tax=Globodera rostochiensis TaxID=31243 RepID=A0A914H0T2_GLORO